MYLPEKDGDEHDFYHQFNGITSPKYVILAYEQGQLVASGAIKFLNSEAMEIKRIFTLLVQYTIYQLPRAPAFHRRYRGLYVGVFDEG